MSSVSFPIAFHLVLSAIMIASIFPWTGTEMSDSLCSWHQWKFFFLLVNYGNMIKNNSFSILTPSFSPQDTKNIACSKISLSLPARNSEISGFSYTGTFGEVKMN